MKYGHDWICFLCQQCTFHLFKRMTDILFHSTYLIAFCSTQEVCSRKHGQPCIQFSLYFFSYCYMVFFTWDCFSLWLVMYCLFLSYITKNVQFWLILHHKVISRSVTKAYKLNIVLGMICTMILDNKKIKQNTSILPVFIQKRY